MGAIRSDLAAVRRALNAARASLADVAGEQTDGASPDPGAIAMAVEHMIDAVASMADFLETPVGDADGSNNTGVVGANMPVGGPKFDRSRPHRGYGHGK